MKNPLLPIVLVLSVGCVDSEPSSGGSEGRGSAEQGLECPVSPAPDLFDAALCVCGDLLDVGTISVNGSAGANGRVDFVNHTRVTGDLRAFAGFNATGGASLGGSLVTPESASFVGSLDIGGDIVVGGDFDGTGTADIAGGLAVQGDVDVVGFVDSAGPMPYVAPSAPPCPCGDQAFDVAAAVDAASASNDNAAVGLPDGAIESIGALEAALPTGSYYLGRVATVGSLNLRIDGVVAIYIDGDVESVGLSDIEMAPGATLDLYIAGNLRHVGQTRVSSGDASALRVYVGGADTVEVDAVGATSLDGLLYAPEATVSFVGTTEIAGGLVAKELAGVGSLRIGGAVPGGEPGDCPPPADPEDPEIPGEDPGQSPPVE